MSISAAVLCLALTVYKEARGESVAGQEAVALVVMNRAEWDSKNVCRTIRAKGQFPWMKPGLAKPSEKKAWARSQHVAHAVMTGQVPDFTRGATYFLGRGERPSWRKKMKFVMTIGGHRFFASLHKSPVTQESKV